MDITPEVFKQSTLRVNHNLFESSQPLRDALQSNAPRLSTAVIQAHARLTHVHAPELHSHDRCGRRIDQVEFHPSYHASMSTAVSIGLHGAPWVNHESPSPHVPRAAGFMLSTELEPSSLCPISTTYAVTPALRANPAICADWAPRRPASRQYDPVLKPWSDLRLMGLPRLFQYPHQPAMPRKAQ